MKINIKASSAIKSVYYDVPRRLLIITFTSQDKEYYFLDVPPKVILGLKKANSVGKYYNSIIRGKYNNAEVDYSNRAARQWQEYVCF